MTYQEEDIGTKEFVFLFIFITTFCSTAFFICAGISNKLGNNFVFYDSIMAYIHLGITLIFILLFIFYIRKNKEMFNRFMKNEVLRFELILDTLLSFIVSFVLGLSFPSFVMYPFLLIVYLMSMSH